MPYSHVAIVASFFIAIHNHAYNIIHMQLRRKMYICACMQEGAYSYSSLRQMESRSA